MNAFVKRDFAAALAQDMLAGIVNDELPVNRDFRAIVGRGGKFVFPGAGGVKKSIPENFIIGLSLRNIEKL